MNKLNLIIISAFLFLLVGCNEEEFNGPIPDLKILVDNPNYDKSDPNSPLLAEYEIGMVLVPGDNITVENKSLADYVSIWTGDEGHNYENFGMDEGANLSGEFYEYKYSVPGSYKMTFVVTSAINRSSDVKREIVEQTIEITDFSATLNSFDVGIADAITETVGDSINITVPFGTDISSLTPVFDAGYATVSVNGIEQESGVTVVEFEDGVPVTYTVTSFDGSIFNDYIITINVVPGNSENWFTDFGFGSMPITVTIDGNTFNVVVPATVDITSLKATFSIPELATVAVDGVEQRSGRTALDYTNPVVFVVTAQDGTPAEYTVIVTQE